MRKKIILAVAVAAMVFAAGCSKDVVDTTTKETITETTTKNVVSETTTEEAVISNEQDDYIQKFGLTILEQGTQYMSLWNKEKQGFDDLDIDFSITDTPVDDAQVEQVKTTFEVVLHTIGKEPLWWGSAFDRSTGYCFESNSEGVDSSVLADISVENSSDWNENDRILYIEVTHPAEYDSSNIVFQFGYIDEIGIVALTGIDTVNKACYADDFYEWGILQKSYSFTINNK